MWDPNRYRDSDYGLRDEERFEPDEYDDADDRPGPGEPYLQTVLGPIRADETGVTLIQEHVFSMPQDGRSEFRLDDPQAALFDLETFFTVGGRTIVDTTCPWEGRSAGTLTWLAQRAPVHIVASDAIDAGGGSVDARIPSAPGRGAPGGLDGTDVQPGILTMQVDSPVDSSSIPFLAARISDVHRVTGLALVLGGAAGSVDIDAVIAVIEAGVRPDRLIISGLGEMDRSTIELLANSGVFLLFDGLGDDERGSDKRTSVRIAELVQEGLRERILLSHGFEKRSLRIGYGGHPGYGFMVEQFAIMLLEAGIAAIDVRAMLIDNCASALAICSVGSDLDT